MVRRNCRPDWRRIKSLRSYSINGAATALGVHRNTVRHWIKEQGLPAFTEQRPHLVQGGDLVAFLKRQRRASRRPCGPGQMFCLKCRKPREPAEALTEYQPINSLRGILVGICPVCESLMRRFVSLPQLAAVGAMATSNSQIVRDA